MLGNLQFLPQGSAGTKTHTSTFKKHKCTRAHTHTRIHLRQQVRVDLAAPPQRGLNGATLQAASLVCYSTAAKAQQQLALPDLSHTHTQGLPCCPVCPGLWLMLLGCQFLAETALNVSIGPALNTSLQRAPAAAPSSETVHQNLKIRDARQRQRQREEGREGGEKA